MKETDYTNKADGYDNNPIQKKPEKKSGFFLCQIK